MTNLAPAQEKKQYIVSITIIGVLFFIFGFITWINGTLIPYLKIACQLKTDLESYLVATAFFIAYAVMALPSSYVLKRTGYKKGMSIGLFVMAVGAIVFVPAANARDYNLFLLGLFIIGSGLALFADRSIPRHGRAWNSSGAQYSMAVKSWLLSLRGGYSNRYSDTDGANGWSAGAGLGVRDFSFNYALTAVGELGMAHQFGVSMRWGTEHRSVRSGDSGMMMFMP